MWAIVRGLTCISSKSQKPEEKLDKSNIWKDSRQEFSKLMRRQLIDSGRPVNPPKDKCKENHTYTLHSQTAEPKTKRNSQEQSQRKKKKKDKLSSSNH